MKVASMQELIYGEAGGWPANAEESRQRHDQILAGMNTPIDLGRALKVAHDAKTDRYAVSFHPAQDKSLALKATNEVAAFVAQHIALAGYWRGRMEDGTLADVNLIQP